MSPELISAIASVATFVVIAATAIAAIIQLRHLQSSNQLQAMLSINQRWDTPEMSITSHYVTTQLPAKVGRPEYAASLLASRRDRTAHPEIFLCDIWEQVGTMVKYRLVSREPLLDIASGVISDQWDNLATSIAIIRQHEGPSLYENFEYLASLSKEWIAAHPDGAYPRGRPRLPLPPPPAPQSKEPS